MCCICWIPWVHSGVYIVAKAHPNFQVPPPWWKTDFSPSWWIGGICSGYPLVNYHSNGICPCYMFNRKYTFKGSIFHCYVSLPEGNRPTMSKLSNQIAGLIKIFVPSLSSNNFLRARFSSGSGGSGKLFPAPWDLKRWTLSPEEVNFVSEWSLRRWWDFFLLMVGIFGNLNHLGCWTNM